MPPKRKLPSAPVSFNAPKRFINVDAEEGVFHSAPQYDFMGDNDFMAPVRQAVYPPLTPVQNTIRENNQQSRENSAPLTAEIYFHLTKKVDDLTKLNQEQEEELYDVRQRVAELERENNELKKKLQEPRKSLTKPTMDAIRRFYKSLPEANQYDVEQTLGSRRNARVMEGLERYVLSHVEFGQTDSRDLTAFLNGQFYNIRASVRKAAKRGIDVTADIIEKRARTTATRRRDKIKGRKRIYELLKGSAEMSLFPFAEHLIDDRYTSEEEDYYSPETYAAARAECCHLSPDGEVDEDTVYAAVIRHPVEGISVFVPSYRSKLFQSFIDTLDKKLPRYQEDIAGIQSGPHSGYKRYRILYQAPVPPFVEKNGVTERNLAWAFNN